VGTLLSRVTSTAQALPSRVFLYAREKWGKSSLFAHAPGAIFFMTRGETGLVELISGGRVPPTAHFDYDEQAPPTWQTLRSAIRELRDEEHGYKFFVVDTANGAEILCAEHVRNTVFRGSQAKFASYGKGWEECRVEWLGLLQDLDALRARRKMTIVMLAHTQVKKFDDPTAEESYDKYRPACADKLWDLTHKWADIICFGHFKAQTYETDSGKVKARADVQRVLCFDQSPLWEAGNRYGVQGELAVGNGAGRAFRAFAELVSKAKAATAPKPPAEPQAAPVQAPAPQQQAAPASAPEGEQRADFPAATPTRPATTATAPATPPSTATTNATPTTTAAPIPTPTPSTPTSDPKPAPAAERRTAPPKPPANPAFPVLELMGPLGVSWPEIRDCRGEGEEISNAAGLGKLPPSARIGDLTPAQMLRLRDILERKLEAKKARAAKLAAGKARKAAERASEEVSAS
jgi:hypothetical protein